MQGLLESLSWEGAGVCMRHSLQTLHSGGLRETELPGGSALALASGASRSLQGRWESSEAGLDGRSTHPHRASASVPLRRGGASLHLISFIVFEAKQSFADAPAIFAIYVLNY